MAKKESRNKAVVRRWNEEVFNGRRVELVDELCDENCAAGFGRVKGRANVKAAFAEYLATAKPTDQVVILDMIEEGDRVAARLRRADGSEQLSLYTLSRGRIVDDRYYVQPELGR